MLKQMGWPHEQFEHVLQKKASLSTRLSRMQQAVHVDRSYHFLRDVSSGEFVVNDATRFRKRLLRKLGWTLASVAFFKWNNETRTERKNRLIANLRREVD